MLTLLYAVALYVIVFGMDYLFYVKQGDQYNYVSRRTYLLFTAGQLLTIWLFFGLFKPFLSSWLIELSFIGLFAALLVLFTHLLTKDKVYVCSVSSRTLRCLTPAYVLVKGSEIVFQQLVYLVIAFSLIELLGLNALTYLVYIVILFLTHIIVILGGGQSVVKTLTFGLIVIAAPVFYIFTEIGIFWPAVYLHSIMYVFYWLTFADFDV